jgi:hypothetical protein
MVDRDFILDQFTFSDTTSAVSGNDFSFAMADLGWSYRPTATMRLGGFVGYHYWREKLTAYGLRCNADAVGGAFCGPPGSVLVAFSEPVIVYQPTWHAVRVGFDWKIDITDRWSFSGEFAAIPYAAVKNLDSHLLRTDLGPSPNVVARSHYAFGAEAEGFINYAVTPNLDLGAGLRYWGLFAHNGGTSFGPGFEADFPLRNFTQQRYGMLLQLKGRI